MVIIDHRSSIHSFIHSTLLGLTRTQALPLDRAGRSAGLREEKADRVSVVSPGPRWGRGEVRRGRQPSCHPEKDMEADPRLPHVGPQSWNTNPVSSKTCQGWAGACPEQSATAIHLPGLGACRTLGVRAEWLLLDQQHHSSWELVGMQTPPQTC